jgi:hypothetical protein
MLDVFPQKHPGVLSTKEITDRDQALLGIHLHHPHPFGIPDGLDDDGKPAQFPGEPLHFLPVPGDHRDRRNRRETVFLMIVKRRATTPEGMIPMGIKMAAGVINHQLLKGLGPVPGAPSIQDVIGPEFRQREVVKLPTVDREEFNPEFSTGMAEEIQCLTVL